MNIAVICKDSSDFLNHKKDSQNTYHEIFEIDKCSTIFDSIEFTPKAIENPNFIQLVDFIKQMIRNNVIEKPKRKPGYYWVKFKGNTEWEIMYFGENEFSYSKYPAQRYSENCIEDICETPITRELLDEAVINKNLDKNHMRVIFEQSRACNISFEEWFDFNYKNKISDFKIDNPDYIRDKKIEELNNRVNSLVDFSKELFDLVKKITQLNI